MGKRKKIIGIVLLFLLALAGWFYYQHQQTLRLAAAHEMKLSGNVDVREVSLCFRQSDRIAELMAEAGDRVQKGQVLARLDTSELSLARNHVAAQAAAQQSAVDKLHNGNRSEDIRQAEEKVRAARAAADYAEGVYVRRQQIYDSVEGVSMQELDNARSQAASSGAQVVEAEQALQALTSGPRSEDIRQAEYSLKALQEELSRQEYLLSQSELRAPADGVIRSRLLEEGDMAGATLPVFKLSLLDKKWVRVYVKETDLGKIYEGKEADVYIDSLPDQPLHGQIGYIASTAEFTPKTVQTDDLRTALVYEVRVDVQDEDNVLRLGMPATVRIEL